MKILITGGNGYIGNSLYNNLYQEYDVKKISRNDLDLTKSKDVSNFFKKNYFDIVFHCAINGGNRLIKDTSKTLDDNLIMYYNLLSNKNFDKFINFGSGAEIYNSNEPYGLSKKIISKSILEKENFYNIRLYGLFDENENERRFIKSNILRYIKKEEIIIHKNKYMDFFYMHDFINVINYYIKNKNPVKDFDCVYNKKYTLLEIANFINDLSDYKIPINIYDDVLDDDYTGLYTNIGLEYYGIKKGIESVYNIFIRNTINV